MVGLRILDCRGALRGGKNTGRGVDIGASARNGLAVKKISPSTNVNASQTDCSGIDGPDLFLCNTQPGISDLGAIAQVHPTEQELRDYCFTLAATPNRIKNDIFFRFEVHMLFCHKCLALAMKYETGVDPYATVNHRAH